MSGAVEHGAALLDEKLPGWEHQINLARLDLAMGCDCVLGQLFGHYMDGRDVLRLGRPGARYHGFDAKPGHAYEPLTARWARLIRRRLANSPEPA